MDWLTKKELEPLDTDDYDPDTHISEWCVTSVLANRFQIHDLRWECELRYYECHGSYWEGTWIPLPSEVVYVYYRGAEAAFLKTTLIKWMVQRKFEKSCLVDATKVAALRSSCESFALDVFRAERQHKFLVVGALEPCGVEGCVEHGQWTEEDIQFVERAEFVSSSSTEEGTEIEMTRGEEAMEIEEATTETEEAEKI